MTAYPIWSTTVGDLFLNPALIDTVGALSSVALTTVGTGTITAAGIVAGVTSRSGSTAAFTDTTDTAAAIIAAEGSGTTTGTSFRWTYVNNTVAAATLAGGTGVTITGMTVIPPNSQAEYLVTVASATTVTILCIGSGYFPASGTFTANGATPVTVTNAAVTATSQVDITLKTVGGTVSPTRPNVLTITAGTGFTVGGVASDTSVYNYTIRG